VSTEERIRLDIQRWLETGELPAAWAPEIDDDQLDEMNRDEAMREWQREQDQIEAGCVEPPPGGWLCQLSRYGEP
jgi:hypothetical protein